MQHNYNNGKDNYQQILSINKHLMLINISALMLCCGTATFTEVNDPRTFSIAEHLLSVEESKIMKIERDKEI